MKLWKRASGVLKDQNSIWIASLSRRTALRNPDIEAAVIKATSHDESSVDYRNSQRVFAWVRVSAAYVKPLVWSISVRMEKTRSWVVAIKGLMLMHGIFCCRVPAISRIGRLPFDLSNFTDGHSGPGRTWGHNTFIRAYYSFLDQKSVFLNIQMQERKKQIKGLGEDHQYSVTEELLSLQKMQGLLDMLLQIKPQADGMIGILILEAMDCIVIEIFDIYSRICNGIASILMGIHSAGKVEAAMALKVLQKATVQGGELTLYFELCRDIGVINATECPKVEQIPEEDVRELEYIINGVSQYTSNSIMNSFVQREHDKAIAMGEAKSAHERKDSTCSLQTIITNEWEVFDEEPKNGNAAENVSYSSSNYTASKTNAVHNHPFASSLSLIPQPFHAPPRRKDDIPDLISFM